MEERCKNCRYWGTETSLGDADQRRCQHPKLGERVEVSERLGDDYDSALDTLEYEYYECGSIFTGPEFGCVHFSPVESTLPDPGLFQVFMPYPESDAHA